VSPLSLFGLFAVTAMLVGAQPLVHPGVRRVLRVGIGTDSCKVHGRSGWLRRSGAVSPSGDGARGSRLKPLRRISDRNQLAKSIIGLERSCLRLDGSMDFERRRRNGFFKTRSVAEFRFGNRVPTFRSIIL
jgi:hypothetical protein